MAFEQDLIDFGSLETSKIELSPARELNFHNFDMLLSTSIDHRYLLPS